MRGPQYLVPFLRQASGEGSTAVATLTCEEEVKMFASTVDDAGKVVKVAVVSDEGNLFLYELGSSALPSSSLSHTYSIQYVSSPPKVCASMVTVRCVCDDLCTDYSRVLRRPYQC